MHTKLEQHESWRGWEGCARSCAFDRLFSFWSFIAFAGWKKSSDWTECLAQVCKCFVSFASLLFLWSASMSPYLFYWLTSILPGNVHKLDRHLFGNVFSSFLLLTVTDDRQEPSIASAFQSIETNNGTCGSLARRFVVCCNFLIEPCLNEHALLYPRNKA